MDKKDVADSIRFDQLFYFVFGISQDGDEQQKKQKCVEKAYLDVCRTIWYKKEITATKRDDFKKNVNKLILDSIVQYPVKLDDGSEVFDR